MKTVEIFCSQCGQPCIKQLREYKRQIKKGQTRFFCNLSCARLKHNEENPPPGTIGNLQKRKLDHYSPFRWYMLRSQYRTKEDELDCCDLDLSYLKELFDNQQGKCPFTGWNLILPKSTYGFKEKLPSNASLDRIDNSKGYIKGNVRFISLMANYARNRFSDYEVIEFCNSVSKYNEIKSSKLGRANY